MLRGLKTKPANPGPAETGHAHSTQHPETKTSRRTHSFHKLQLYYLQYHIIYIIMCHVKAFYTYILTELEKVNI